ncbi:MAG: hypothetical protein WD810_03190 [Solirubrobacterales bacterium]
MYRGVVAVVVCAFAIASLAAGCGSGDESLTKAEFIERGDAICAKAESRKNAVLEAAFLKQSESKKPLDRAAELKLVTTVALPPIVQMTDRLAALEPPSEEEDKARAIVEAYEEGIAGVESDPSSVLGGANPFAEADELAEEFGFEACSEI